MNSGSKPKFSKVLFRVSLYDDGRHPTAKPLTNFCTLNVCYILDIVYRKVGSIHKYPYLHFKSV